MIDYELLNKQIESVIKDTEYNISNLANISAIIYDSIDNLNWVGFYYNVDNKLLLGPFKGKVACTVIEYGKGVCGTSLKENKTIVVKDVHEFTGHIACDSASLSEIVIPIHKDNKIYALLDIDSPKLNRFNNDDKNGLELIAKTIEKYLR